jgi:inositol-phosphate phosphatase/L-galactose 1-phosphate phosphatase/histidinol-phosphatase
MTGHQQNAGQLLAFAQELAETSGAIIRRYFRAPLQVDAKADESPVTIADREAETALRARIEETYPEHGIFGEEFGRIREEAEYLWLLDPIDGTKAFISGKPIFGTLIALLHRGVPVLGIIDQPVLRERWVGATGQPTTFNGAPAQTRPCKDLANATLNATSPDMFEGTDHELFEHLASAVRLPHYGGDCYGYGLLALGFIDLVAEADLKPYDFAPLIPIIEGAGGVITDWSGAPLTTNSDGRVLAAGDLRAHARALALLAGNR